MKISKALRNCKPYLKGTENPTGSKYICLAIGRARKNDWWWRRSAYTQAMMLVLDSVKQICYGCVTLYGALIESESMSWEFDSPQYWTYRNVWLNALIENLEGQGK